MLFYPFLPSHQAKHKCSPLLVDCSRPESTLPQLQQEQMNSQRKVLEVARFFLAWNVWACLMCCCFVFFFLKSLWLDGYWSASHKKPSQMNLAFQSAGGDWCHNRLKAVFLCLAPVLPLDYKHGCELVQSFWLPASVPCRQMTVKLFTTRHHFCWPAITNSTCPQEEDHVNSCCSANSLELTMQNKKTKELTSGEDFWSPAEFTISSNFKWGKTIC